MDTKTLWKLINFYARFTPSYTKLGYYARRLFWKRTSPRDFSGQRWLITGASTGLGKAMLDIAAGAGAEVIAVANHPQRLAAAIEALPAEARQSVTGIATDLSLVSEAHSLVDRLLSKHQGFDVVVNNAGYLHNDLHLTAEGFEASYVINVLSHFILTEGLINGDALTQNAVVINMTSGGMYNAPQGTQGLNLTDPKTYQGKVAYAFAKRAQVALTTYWNSRYQTRGIRFYATHPGWSKTPGVKVALPVFYKIQNLILRTPKQGADTALWLAATKPETGSEETVWFDRQARPSHIYEATKTPLCSQQELVDYLQAHSRRS